MLRATSIWAAGAALLVAAGSASPQNPVHWTVQPPNGVSLPGRITTLALNADVEDGWHLYSISQGLGGPIPTRVTVFGGEAVSLAGKVTGPKPVKTYDQNFGMDVELYQGSVKLAIPVRLKLGAKPGKYPVTLAVRYQACTESLCLPPRTVQLSTELRVVRGA